jgi:hypothetical protein
MKENYYNLKTGENEKQFGIVLRVREGKLEELTGFCNPKEIGKTSKGVLYEMNVNTNGYGRPIGKEDIIGLIVYSRESPELEIYKQPKTKKAVISRIRMSGAAKILEDIQYIKDMENMI